MELTWTIIIIIILFGILFGFLSSCAGIGGGVFYVAFLTLIIGLSLNEAIDTSIFIILIASGVALITFIKEKKVSLKLSLIYSSFSILGSITSTIILLFIHLDTFYLKLIFVFVVFATSGDLIFNIIHKSRKHQHCLNEAENDSFLKNFDYKQNLKTAIPFFFLAGFLSNLIGIGGGIITTPMLYLFLGFPIHYAAGVSTAVIFFTAIVNTIIKIYLGKINYMIGILLGIGSIFGAYLGAKASCRMPEKYLQIFVAVVLIYFGIQMLI